MVAGSGNTQGGDASHAAVEEAKEELVPGPLTRLFVVANKGVAALIQDLILVRKLRLWLKSYNHL